MKLSNTVLVSLACTLLIACQPADRVYIEHRELSTELEWRRADSRTFEVPISDTTQTYRMSLGFRYATGFPYQFAKVKVTEQAPSGDKKEKLYKLKIRELNGDYIGEPGLEIWDSEHVVEEAKQYREKGKYTYTMTHAMEKDVMPMAMEVSLILDKANSQK